MSVTSSGNSKRSVSASIVICAIRAAQACTEVGGALLAGAEHPNCGVVNSSSSLPGGYLRIALWKTVSLPNGSVTRPRLSLHSRNESASVESSRDEGLFHLHRDRCQGVGEVVASRRVYNYVGVTYQFPDLEWSSDVLIVDLYVGLPSSDCLAIIFTATVFGIPRADSLQRA